MSPSRSSNSRSQHTRRNGTQYRRKQQRRPHRLGARDIPTSHSQLPLGSPRKERSQSQDSLSYRRNGFPRQVSSPAACCQVGRLHNLLRRRRRQAARTKSILFSQDGLPCRRSAMAIAWAWRRRSPRAGKSGRCNSTHGRHAFFLGQLPGAPSQQCPLDQRASQAGRSTPCTHPLYLDGRSFAWSSYWE